ncbi:ABC transporter ATP-binding protein, partial [Vallitalea maricola]|uniref:ABC transporter ATP-binding protein n=1 Tax=Vallitalea maricola TaxID=3074433 RepID=UPI0030DD3CAF
MTILETKKLKKYYDSKYNITKAVDDINIKITQGQFTVIIGKSGSGKSTLLHLLGALDRPTNGQVIIDQVDMYKLKDNELAKLRRKKIGFVFQSYNLIPSLNVWQNIILPIGLDHKPVDEEYIKDIINTLGLQDKINSMPNTLSGGQQQRVAIARAL